jgi:hypothetical protein
LPLLIPQKRQRREGMPRPDDTRLLLGVRHDARPPAEDPGEPPRDVIGGPARIAVTREPGPRRPHLRGQRDRLGTRRMPQKHGGLPGGQIPEDQRHIQAVARAQRTVHSGRRPREFVEMCPPTTRDLRLGEVKRRHPEQPVGVDQLVEPIRTRIRVRSLVVPRREDRQRLSGPRRSHPPQLPGHEREQALLVPRVPGHQLDAAARTRAQSLPGCDRQNITVDHRSEQNRPVSGLPPPLAPPGDPRGQRVSRRDQQSRIHFGQIGDSGPEAQLTRDGGTDVTGQGR